eukprot:CAMPEP_0114344764 /NCGR_PEP_ID=MMETSP0101-20121206/11678_1 /TAXON_ID=38822 ORGANISM="Pteridomonas danica, Strain PT" /NCGR_SAMPLE_ID=MMETSP0101 /ASSEMBLY_ACC=CAM_ASM_000211 /LENGTH=52 /DNA_ID=CAMNT_0001480303 /DNA_START=729 /DNA_END=887 /DNA_ORIENTATION=-
MTNKSKFIVMNHHYNNHNYNHKNQKKKSYNKVYVMMVLMSQIIRTHKGVRLT